MSRPRASHDGNRSRGRRLFGVLGLALLLVPTAELAVVVVVGHAIGGWPTLGLLVAESALGAWLVRREGSRAWQALRQALASGRMPAGELSDAALLLVGGTLLLTPGFLTDVVGFVFVLPLTRPLMRRVLARVVAKRLMWAGGSVVQGTVLRDDPVRRDDPRLSGHDETGRTE